MADYILLAEFDDLKGKVIRYSHPTNLVDDLCNKSKMDAASSTLHKTPTTMMGSSGVAAHQKRSASHSQSPTLDAQTLQERIPEFIIPDTGYDRMIDCIFFTLNRPKLATSSGNMRQLLKSKQSLLGKIFQDPSRRSLLKKFEGVRWRIKFYNVIDLKWEPYSGIQDKDFFFMIQKINGASS